MKANDEVDQLLIERIRAGDGDAWKDLIDRFEGRLLAFVDSRLNHRSASEDVVQECFVGFLNSLPNYDGRRSLESYLFSICAYKMTDYLRREGRRPAIPMAIGADSSGDWNVSSSSRVASSIARSTERRRLEHEALLEAIRDQVDRWQERGDWTKLKCIELLVVRGWGNKEVADELGISEQQVANFKFDFISRMRTLVQRQGLSEDVFPELYERNE
jgi:RNA polymerase sigma-70 factor (ECF subfamily)